MWGLLGPLVRIFWGGNYISHILNIVLCMFCNHKFDIIFDTVDTIILCVVFCNSLSVEADFATQCTRCSYRKSIFY